MRKLLKTEQCQEGVRGIAEVLVGALAVDTVEQVQDIVEQGFAAAHIAALAQEAVHTVVRVPAVGTVVGAHIGVQAPAAVDIVADTAVVVSALVAGNTEQVLRLAVVDRRAPVVAGALLPPPL
jgi:hypothetical protein